MPTDDWAIKVLESLTAADGMALLLERWQGEIDVLWTLFAGIYRA